MTDTSQYCPACECSAKDWCNCSHICNTHICDIDNDAARDAAGEQPSDPRYETYMQMNGNRIPVLDHGYIELLDHMGSDIDIVNAARTSFDTHETDMTERNVGLINFLMRERHGTPFEMVEFKFAVKAPIFVFREWHRHRIASINEMSGRYVELEREFYVPARDDIREQKGKPGAYYYERMESDERAAMAQHTIKVASDNGFDAYQNMLNDGVAKEVARLVLPVNTYSKMVWKTNLRALMNFVSLRNHEHAQREIMYYASIMEQIVSTIVPVAIESFIEYGRRTP